MIPSDKFLDYLQIISSVYSGFMVFATNTTHGIHTLQVNGIVLKCMNEENCRPLSMRCVILLNCHIARASSLKAHCVSLLGRCASLLRRLRVNCLHPSYTKLSNQQQLSTGHKTVGISSEASSSNIYLCCSSASTCELTADHSKGSVGMVLSQPLSAEEVVVISC